MCRCVDTGSNVGFLDILGVGVKLVLSWRPGSSVVEHEIGNLRVASSSPALGTDRNGPPFHL